MLFLLLASGGNNESLGERLGNAFMPAKVRFFGLEVSPSFVSAVFISVFLMLLALVLYFTVVRKLKKIPGRLQSFLEMAVGTFDKIAGEQTHEFSGFVGPYIFTAAIFICIGTLVELVGIRPIFSGINASVALGLTTFFLINIFALKRKGLVKRIGRYKNPILIVTDLSVPLSLSIRLFGSVTSGFLIMEMLYFSLATSLVVPAFVSVITTLMHAFVQAYVFALLTSLFIGEAIE